MTCFSKSSFKNAFVMLKCQLKAARDDGRYDYGCKQTFTFVLL